ncbi:GspE/PulE family protein [Methylophaga sp. UBA2689]|jgi:type II secretory ATPase GspE/PulE/Tfp pilus assembly ATPase PilB-like protein|uniref:GspE/PulE family protein n=1 Tax=Methylophaga sp. UBA2689 TaxID=1946878 RepID=UPI0025E32DE8|nr:GspE/PulE family protein [Methylophaga sp. UBA2689]|tara:strand:- start:6841 stop:8508 length:1668 start_codon:yes stop_codon:yes gene_type:complete
MALTDELLMQAGVATELLDGETVERLRVSARRERVPILSKVLAHYRIPVSALHRAVAESRQIPFIDLTTATIDRKLLKKLPGSLIKRKHFLPVQIDQNLMLVTADPDDMAGIAAATRLIGAELPIVMAEPKRLKLMVDNYLATSAMAVVEENATAPLETDLVVLLDTILTEAYLTRASDVHLLTEEEGLRIRLRIDGSLSDYPLAADQSVASGLVSRIKVLAGLDIAEQRQPQDGGFTYHLVAPFDLDFNIRVATAPTRLGERITMRLLGQESGGLTLTDLGMLEQDLARFSQAIRNPYGMILLTGPTGSGKSTTLFAALQEINKPDINIMTVENPIEYVIEGVSQIQTGPKISFADALRSLLRHDPDVLMVGEIRDAETADVAVKAAMTGHLVFSTLHTNNAVSAVTRLIDIGCEPFLIGSTMTAVIAQRLVRRLCRHCASKRTATEAERQALGYEDEIIEIFDPVGCAVCQGTGFRGRLGLFETLWFDEQLARMVAKGADEETLEQAAGDKLRFMWQDGCEKVLRGMTTLEEIQKVAVVKHLSQSEVTYDAAV